MTNLMTEQDRDLYDMIKDLCPKFENLDAEQCQEFMNELSDLGITTAQQFEDAYFYSTDMGWDPGLAECEFAEFFVTEVHGINLPTFLVIDWQATWDKELSHDFSTIDFGAYTYFFKNNH